MLDQGMLSTEDTYRISSASLSLSLRLRTIFDWKVPDIFCVNLDGNRQIELNLLELLLRE